MTIAAGFVHRDGVLLCADTQHETLTMKSHATKLHQLDYWDGHIAFAYAGNSAFALSTIERCTKRIEALHNGEDPVTAAEKILDAEYRRVVYKHPDRLIDPNVGYYFLMAVHRRSKGRTELHASYEVTIRQIFSYEALGIGKPLADYLVKPFYTRGQSEHDAVCFAAQVVSIAKEHVPGCGGMSLLLSLRNDGTIGEFYNDHLIKQLETEAPAYFMKAQDLLFQHVDGNLSTADFEMNLHLFDNYVLEMRQRWDTTWEKYKPRPVG